MDVDGSLTRPQPPAAEYALGLRSYLTGTSGIGGRLRGEPEDFVVVELGDGPAKLADGAFMATRVRLKNWETNRFAMQAARALSIHREQVAFAGMKDKRAVTEQWFTFKTRNDPAPALNALNDVEVLESYSTRKSHFPGAHTGNRFVIRVRDSTRDVASVEACAEAIRTEGGVPNFFGPQRFGGHFRALTHLVGKAIVAGDLEEAVRLYVGHPMPEEQEQAQVARRIYDETRDPAAALAEFPEKLDPERAILQRLIRKPGDWRNALNALPLNLLQLFVHAHQSWLYNHIIAARVEAGLGLTTAQVGDLAMGVDDDGIRVHQVNAFNQKKIQREIVRGRSTLTAPLVGTGSVLATGRPGEIEAAVLAEHKIEPQDFRIIQLPEIASDGRRRGILQPVRDLHVEWVEGDPIFAFALGKGSYATVVLREFMKAELSDY